MAQQASRRVSRIGQVFFLVVVVVIALIAVASKPSGTLATAAGSRPVVRTMAGLVQGRSTGAFAAEAGCPGNTASCLRRLPVSAVIDHEDFSGYTPNADGTMLPQTIRAALADGQFNHVPVIIGTNHDEWRPFIPMARLRGGRSATWPWLGSITGRRTSQRSSTCSRCTATPYSGPLTAAQQLLARSMQQFWTHFAATGVPIAQWPRFTLASPRAVALSAQGAVIATDYATEHHCGFWATAG